MSNRIFLVLIFLAVFRSDLLAQHARIQKDIYKGVIERDDGKQVPFNFEMNQDSGRPVIYIRNGKERLRVDSVVIDRDSIFIQMPVFESQFRVKVLPDGNWRGAWVRGTSLTTEQKISFYALAGEDFRFAKQSSPPLYNISGKWQVNFSEETITRPAIAEFHQENNQLYGTFLTPSGDYRYLEGRVSADTMQLSVFDGTHAYYFIAKLLSDSNIQGMFYAGSSHIESWIATRDENAELPDELSAMNLRPGEERLNFKFHDLDGNEVAISGDRFRNKVVVVQIMGSWCPNCMDETAFLSEYFSTHRKLGVEIVALAYEYSTDLERSRKSLRKFQQRFKVEYPILITGVTSDDPLRTEKTLPQLTPIKAFPTTIFIGRDGKVKKIHGGFYGPGTGVHYDESRKRFYDTVNELLK